MSSGPGLGVSTGFTVNVAKVQTPANEFAVVLMIQLPTGTLQVTVAMRPGEARQCGKALVTVADDCDRSILIPKPGGQA